MPKSQAQAHCDLLMAGAQAGEPGQADVQNVVSGAFGAVVQVGGLHGSLIVNPGPEYLGIEVSCGLAEIESMPSSLVLINPWNFMQLQIVVDDMLIKPMIGPGGLSRDQAHTEIQHLLDQATRLDPALKEIAATWRRGAADDTCTCRKPHPRRLSSPVVLMDDSARSVLSIYGEAFDLAGFEWNIEPSSVTDYFGR
jgi:hypothetical protein